MMKFRITSKSFGQTKILGQMELDLNIGTVTALLGPSGIGKSTLLRIIGRLDYDDARTPQPVPKLGMLFQEPRLLPWLTALQNVEMVADERGLFGQLGIGDVQNLYPRQLSLGMARRVAVARALAAEPQLLILDEPFASLDHETTKLVQRVLRNEAANTGLTILLVTHDLVEARELASRIYVLEGKPSQLRTVSS